MQSLIGTRCIASATEHVATLADSSSGDENLGADGVARALGTAHQLERHPVVRVFHDIAQQSRRRIYVVQNHIDVAVVEQITEGGPARGNHDGETAACSGGNSLKL